MYSTVSDLEVCADGYNLLIFRWDRNQRGGCISVILSSNIQCNNVIIVLSIQFNQFSLLKLILRYALRCIKLCSHFIHINPYH